MEGQCRFEDSEDAFRIFVPLGQSLKAKGVRVALKEGKLTVGVLGAEVALQATLPGKAEVDWEIVEKGGRRMLNVELEKARREGWEPPSPANLPAMVQIVAAGQLTKAKTTHVWKLFEKGEHQKAINELRQGKEAENVMNILLVNSLISEAMGKVNAGNSKAAKKQLDEALPLMEGQPSLLQSLYQLTMAEVYRHEFKNRLALEALESALQHLESEEKESPKLQQQILQYRKNCKLQRSQTNMDMGNVEECLSELQELVDAEPRDKIPCSRLADALLELVGDVPRALKVWTAIDTKDASMHDLHVTAACAFVVEDWTLAQKYADMICSQEPSPAGGAAGQQQSKAFQDGLRLAYILAKRQNKLALAEELKQKLETWTKAERQTRANELFGTEVMFIDIEPIDPTWDYVASTPLGEALPPSLYYASHQMLEEGMKIASLSEGLIMEFGVYHGKSLRQIAGHFKAEEVHGFDSFQGLPERWNENPAGAYSTQGEIPTVPSNVRLHVGLFGSTLPQFLKEHAGPVKFVNIDCDIYSSTKDIFDHIHPRIVPGSIVMFDEYVGVRNWQEHEFAAFQEAVGQYGWSYEYLAISLLSNQAMVRITAVEQSTS